MSIQQIRAKYKTKLLATNIKMTDNNQFETDYNNITMKDKMIDNNNQFATDYINITMRHFNTSDPNQRFTEKRAIHNIRQAQSKSAPSEFFKVNFLGTRCGFPLRRSYIAPFLIAEGKLL